MIKLVQKGDVKDVGNCFMSMKLANIVFNVLGRCQSDNENSCNKNLKKSASC